MSNSTDQPTEQSSEGSTLEPEFVRVPGALRVAPIGRTRMYELFDINGGPIRTALIRKPGAVRGIRLVHLESLREFLRLCMEDENKSNKS